jgi:hypothetical protein
MSRESDEDITSMDTTSPIRWSWSSTCFWTAEEHLLTTVFTASYGFQFGVLLLHGKINKATLRQIQPHMDTLSESVTITDFIQRCILSTVSLFLYAFIDDSENRLLPNNVMMIRNYGEDKEGHKERRGGAKLQQRQPSQVGVPIQVELEFNSDSRNSRHQNFHPDHIPTPFWTFFTWVES